MRCSRTSNRCCWCWYESCCIRSWYFLVKCLELTFCLWTGILEKLWIDLHENGGRGSSCYWQQTLSMSLTFLRLHAPFAFAAMSRANTTEDVKWLAVLIEICHPYVKIMMTLRAEMFDVFKTLQILGVNSLNGAKAAQRVKLVFLRSVRVFTLRCNEVCPPTVLWHSWLGGRMGIRPVKKYGGMMEVGTG